VQVNVATLLQERVGSSRELEIHGETIAVESFDYRRSLNGHLNLLRSERGVIAHLRAHFDVALECARCLDPFDDKINVEFHEEYILGSPHPITGELPEPADDDLLIDEHWHLDLSEAVRQYELSAVPMIPLCKPDCLGFVDVVPTESSPLKSADDRWSKLSGLAIRLHEEESNGAPEA
tara:strand:- start:299 stop:832 length:534 start_codon:yes stop_codon:yes gene_type:complete